MSVNNALLFRSQLMQQFAAAARSQTRPPLALLSSSTTTSSTSGNNPSSLVGSTTNTNSSGTTTWHSTHPHQTTTTPSSSRHHNRHQHFSSNNNSTPPIGMNHTTSSTNSRPQTNQKDYDYDGEITLKHTESISMNELANNFQSLIMTRRTISRFQLSSSQEEERSLAAIVERAVSCAVTAPNHYRTEPVTFKRFSKDSNTAQKLMNICFEVAMRRKKSIERAQQKVDKWKTISSFVAVTVRSQPNQTLNNEQNDNDNDDSYETLPFHPPQTERQLEDYATACASVQNLLLSLHSEGVGSKWATGPIIRCRAFRDLINCRDDELIAGLIMIGEPWGSSSKTMKRRRLRRSFTGDLLQDLD